MLFSNRDMQINSIDEVAQLLSHASYLTEQECIYYPEMVPVRENTRLNRNIIRLEDFIDYSLSNGITDGGYSLAQICEANNISQNSVAFSVDEVSLLEDSEMEDTAKQLMNTGAEIYAVPINESDIVYILAEITADAANIAYQQGDEDYCDALIEAYINNDIDFLFQEQYIVESLGSRVKNFGEKVQSGFSKGVHTISKKAASMGKLARRKVSDGVGAFQNKMTQGADYLKNTLTGLKKRVVSHESSEYGKGILDNVKRAFSGPNYRSYDSSGASSSGVGSIGNANSFQKGMFGSGKDDTSNPSGSAVNGQGKNFGGCSNSQPSGSTQFA